MTEIARRTWLQPRAWTNMTAANFIGVDSKVKKELQIIAAVLTMLLGLHPLCAVSADPFSASAAAQTDWDLTYKRIFSEAGLSEHDSLVGAFGRGDASVMPIFADPPNEPIEAAIFIDTVAFWYFGYRQQTLMVKTPAGATAYSFFEKGSSSTKDSVPEKSFDLLLGRLAKWPPTAPNPLLVSKYRDKGILTGGFVGVVSVFGNAVSRQFLLTFEDIIALDVENGRMTGEPGPFGKLLEAAAASATAEELDRRLNAGAIGDRLFAAAKEVSSDSAIFADLTPKEASQLGRDGRSLLMVAAESGNVAAVVTLINQGAEVNRRAKIPSGPYTTLGMAARAGQKAVVEELLRHGAAVTNDETGYRPYSEPLFEAAHAGHLDVVRLLIEHGADAKGLTSHDDTLLSYLFFGGRSPHREMVEFVLGQGVDINSPNRFGETPLMRAVKTTDQGFEVVALLIERGADVNAVTGNGESVLKAAQSAADSSPKILALLADNAAQRVPKEKDFVTTTETAGPATKRYEIQEISTDDLDRVVKAASQKELVVVIFCAEWAQPYCPNYRKTVEALPRTSAAPLVWVTAGENDAAALAPYQVMSFPHTVVVWQGKLLGDQAGVLTPEQFEKLIQNARKRLS